MGKKRQFPVVHVISIEKSYNRFVIDIIYDNSCRTIIPSRIIVRIDDKDISLDDLIKQTDKTTEETVQNKEDEVRVFINPDIVIKVGDKHYNISNIVNIIKNFERQKRVYVKHKG